MHRWDSIAEKEVMNDADLFADELKLNQEDQPDKVDYYKKKKLKNTTAGKRRRIKVNPAPDPINSKKSMPMKTNAPSSSVTTRITALPTRMPASLLSPESLVSLITWRKLLSIQLTT